MTFIQTVDKPKDWYKSMFKVMHKAGRSGYVGDMNSDYEPGNHSFSPLSSLSRHCKAIKLVPIFTLENDSGSAPSLLRIILYLHIAKENLLQTETIFL